MVSYISLKKNIGLFILSIIFGGIVLQLFSLQIIQGNRYASISSAYTTSKINKYPARGLFLDEESHVLADNKEVYNITLLYNSRQEENLLFLRNINLSNYLYNLDSKVSNQHIQIGKYIDKADLEKIEKEISEIKEDILITPVLIRNYKYPELYSHIIGYVQSVSEEDILNGFYKDEFIGKYKLEKQLDEKIRGKLGKEVRVGNQQVLENPIDGENVKITIKHEWQSKLYELFRKYDDIYSSFGAAGGSGVIIDVETGKIKTMVSFPGFDTNQLVSGTSQVEIDKLANSRSRPLLDKAISVASSPGSVFKIISAYSLLENNVITPYSTYYSNRCISIGDRELCEFNKNYYGILNIQSALYKSSNIFFCHYMQNLENTMGINEFIRSANKLGIGRVTGIDIEGEIPGVMDTPDLKRKLESRAWFTGDTCNASIGQGSILVTPIQMAVIVSALNNGGIVYQPSVIESGQENTIVSKLDIADDTSSIIVEGLRMSATNQESAIYHLLYDLPGNITAKTGSAETFENINNNQIPRTHSWIIGTFDYENKKYSYAFWQQYGGGGYYITSLLRDFIISINN